MDSFSIRLENRKSLIEIRRGLNTGVLDADCSNSMIVTDENLAAGPASALIDAFGGETLILSPGEAFKNLGSVEKILERALSTGLDRQALFIGIGGGVICDMTAFAASVFMRGCRLALFPSTLLSMVDASIGGKTGVDFIDKKNLVGSFYPAERVLIDVGFLKSLPESEFRSGLAEVLKHAFLDGPELMKYIEENKPGITNREPDVLEELVSRSLRVKARYVEKDFREQGIRAHLNFGHTFGHAFEAAVGLGRFTHGEAVAWGIERALRAGVEIGLTDADYAARVRTVLLDFGYDLDFNDFDRKVFFDALSADKKKKGGVLRFILQKNIGETVIKSLDLNVIDGVL